MLTIEFEVKRVMSEIPKQDNKTKQTHKKIVEHLICAIDLLVFVGIVILLV